VKGDFNARDAEAQKEAEFGPLFASGTGLASGNCFAYTIFDANHLYSLDR